MFLSCTAEDAADASEKGWSELIFSHSYQMLQRRCVESPSGDLHRTQDKIITSRPENDAAVGDLPRWDINNNATTTNKILVSVMGEHAHKHTIVTIHCRPYSRLTTRASDEGRCRKNLPVRGKP